MSFLVGGVREERFKTPLSADASSSARSPGTAGTYSSTLKRSNQSEALDHAFTSLVFEIQHRLELVAHVHRVRLERWLRKLHEPVRAPEFVPRDRAGVPKPGRITSRMRVAR